MDWVTVATVIAAVVAVVVFLQGLRLLLRTGSQLHMRLFGSLSLLIAVLVIIGAILYSDRNLVMSSEYGLALVQGPWAGRGLGFLLFGIALSVPLGWEVARLDAQKNYTERWIWLLAIAPVIGALSVARIQTLNPYDSPVFQIYQYDYLWPPLLLWVALGLMDIGFTVVSAQSRRVRVFTASFLVFLIAVYILTRPLLSDAQSRTWWQVILFYDGLLFSFIGLERIAALLFDRRPWRDKLRFGSALRGMQSPSGKEWMLLISLIATASGVVLVLFEIVPTGPAAGLTVFLLGWFGFSEVVSDGQARLLVDDVVERIWVRLPIDWVTSPRAPTAAPVVPAAAGASSALAAKPGLKVSFLDLIPNASVPRAAILGILGLGILIVLNEWNSAGKTIILPFAVVGIKDDSGVMNAFSGYVVNELSALNHEFQSLVIVPVVSLGLGSQPNTDYVRAASQNTTVAPTFDSQAPLDLGFVKIPPDLLISPIQSWIRPLLGVRRVAGTIQPRGNQMILLATSSNGEAWTAAYPSGSDLAGAVPDLAQRLAFQIISTSPGLSLWGMTQSWEAYEAYRTGSTRLKDFEHTQDYAALTEAIAEFRNAVNIDPSFALAFLQLGIALQADGQPEAAEAAFNKGLAASPGFDELKNVSAYHLYYFDTYYFPTAGALITGSRPTRSNTQTSHRLEAERLWHVVTQSAKQVASKPIRASAFAGLCLATYDDAQDVKSKTDPASVSRLQLITYYYCQRANGMFAELPPIAQADPLIARSHAQVLDIIGLLINDRAIRNERAPSSNSYDRWSCRSIAVDSSGNPTYSYFAQDETYVQTTRLYFQQALNLLPGDVTLRCNDAVSALSVGDSMPMRELESDATVRLILANGELATALTAAADNGTLSAPSPYLPLALSEFEAVIELDHNRIDALNNYAYAYAVFRLHWPDAQLSKSFNNDPQATALADAQRALQLAVGQSDQPAMLAASATDGAMLLVTGDAFDAVKVLGPLASQGAIPPHARFDGVRWVASQAYICEAQMLSQNQVEAKARLMIKAEELLDQIKDNESHREYRPFTDYPGAFDLHCKFPGYPVMAAAY